MTVWNAETVAGPRSWGRFGDRDGDDFVEYMRPNPHGLINQGWKDSWDGINFADGRMAEPPIALCEVQAYVFSAYIARSLLAHLAGHGGGEQHWAERAAALERNRRRRQSGACRGAAYVAGDVHGMGHPDFDL
jgi:glycogen debranching enzyme